MTSAAAPGKIKGTSITAPSNSGDNHTLVLGQLKETTEIAQRLRGDPQDSFVRVSELNSSLGTRLVNGTIQPPTTTTTSGGTSSVTASGSITGAGTVASPLQFVNDNATPGNSMVYGTNASGVKGWYAAATGGSGSVTITDGTTTVTGVTTLTFSGATVSGATPNATATITGGSGSVQYPGTINDLVFWFDASHLNLVSNGASMPVLPNSCPFMPSLAPISNTAMGATVTIAALNGLSVLTFNGTGNAYLFPAGGAQGNGLPLVKSTGFVVCKTAVPATNQAIFGPGTSGAIEWYIGSSAFGLSAAFVGGVGVSTASIAANTWIQANYTWDTVAGPYAFRQQRATAGSGSGTASVTIPVNGIGFLPGTGQYFSGAIAELIVYNRVLLSTEISAMEAYLAAKWFPPSNYNAVVLADNPVGYWKMQETSGTVAIDSGPNGLNGVYTGSAFSLAQPSLALNLGASVQLGTSGGGTGYISVPHNSLFDFNGTSFTYEMWIQGVNLYGYQEPMTKGNAVRIVFASQYPVNLYVNGGSYGTQLGTTFTNGQTFHLVIVCNQSTNQTIAYVNGVVDTIIGAAFTTSDTVSPFIIGDLISGGSPVHQVQGYMSNVAIYGTALSATRIAAHYAAGV